MHFLHGLGDRLTGSPSAFTSDTRRTLFLAGVWILNCELRVVSLSALPESAHGLLASVHNFCESGGMRMQFA